MNILRLGITLRKTAARAFAAFVDGRVPGRLKCIAFAATLFVVSPLNIFGDIPLLGVLDDAALVSLILMWFVRASLPYQRTIDAVAVARRA